MTVYDALERCGLRWPRSGFLHCPLHPDKQPSLKLYQDHYYCFSCQATGDAYGLIAVITGRDIGDVLRQYAPKDSTQAPTRKVVQQVGPNAMASRWRRKITVANTEIFAALHAAFHAEQTEILVEEITRESERFEEFIDTLDGLSYYEAEKALDAFVDEEVEWFTKERERLGPLGTFHLPINLQDPTAQRMQGAREEQTYGPQ